MANDLIYDVGMHNGNDTAFYLECDFRVLAVEADPDLVAAAGKRFKAEIESKRLTILNVAIAERATTAEFWINEVSSQLNSFSREFTARLGDPHHSIQVQCRRLDEILSEHGVPHYLKIDIEGHDIVCCNQLSIGSRPKYISVEMSRAELLFRLRDLGYNRFKLINQRHLQPVGSQKGKPHLQLLWSIYRAANYRKEDRRLPLRLGRASAAKVLKLASVLGLWGVSTFKSRMMPNWNFVEGSSGTFGEDLPGEWLGWEEIACIWDGHLKECEKLRQEPWCDLHASAFTENSEGIHPRDRSLV